MKRKNKNTIVLSRKKKMNTKTKLILCILLIIFLIFSIRNIVMCQVAIKNEVTRPVWDLNVYQYTDIAIYINNHSDDELNSENAIKTLYIDNIKLNGVKKGEQSLYFKNAPDFGKSIYSTVEKKEDADSNKIGDKLEFSVLKL